MRLTSLMPQMSDPSMSSKQRFDMLEMDDPGQTMTALEAARAIASIVVSSLSKSLCHRNLPATPVEQELQRESPMSEFTMPLPTVMFKHILTYTTRKKDASTKMPTRIDFMKTYR